jgi:hypothetical protein
MDYITDEDVATVRYSGTRHPLAAFNPLRSMPLLRPASVLARSAPQPLCVAVSLADTDPTWIPRLLLAPSQRELAGRELRNAEAALLQAIRAHASARIDIGEANRRVLPGTRYSSAITLLPERVRQRKSAAFSLFNRRRGELSRARHRVDAARAVLGLPSLAEQEEREDAAADRVIRRRRQPIGQIALPF